MRAARQSLLPMRVKSFAFSLDVLDCGERNLQRRWLDDLQQPLDHERFERLAREALTKFATVVDRVALATVTQRTARILFANVRVLNQHSITATTADNQPGQHAGAVSRSGHCHSQMAVFPQLLLDSLECLPIDVGVKAIVNQHATVLVAVECATGCWSTSDLLPRVHFAMSPAISTGVDRMMQHIIERRPIGPAPSEFAAIAAEVRTHRHLDVVADHPA